MKRLLIGSSLFVGATLAAPAAPVVDIEPNDSPNAAQSLDGQFTIDELVPNPLIGDEDGELTSTVIPNVSIIGTGDGSQDFFSFTVTQSGSLGIFDVDLVSGVFNSVLTLWDPGGNLIQFNEDAPSIIAGAGGSTSTIDAFIEFLFEGPPGVYFVSIDDGAGNIPVGATYQLNVSLENAILQPPSQVPEPSSAILLSLCGLVGGGVTWRRRRISRRLD